MIRLTIQKKIIDFYVRINRIRDTDAKDKVSLQFFKKILKTLSEKIKMYFKMNISKENILSKETSKEIIMAYGMKIFNDTTNIRIFLCLLHNHIFTTPYKIRKSQLHN